MQPITGLSHSLSRQGRGWQNNLKIERSQHVFKQGDAADAVFYIQKGKEKLTVLSEQGKEAVVGIRNRASSSARGASMAIGCVSRPQRRWRNA